MELTKRVVGGVEILLVPLVCCAHLESVLAQVRVEQNVQELVMLLVQRVSLVTVWQGSVVFLVVAPLVKNVGLQEMPLVSAVHATLTRCVGLPGTTMQRTAFSSRRF